MGLLQAGGGRSGVGLGKAVAQALFDAADPGATRWQWAGQVEDQGLRGGAAGGEGSPEMSPTDFYAGAIAAFVVILFTKFFTHRQRQPGFGSGNRQDIAWWIGHWICVSAAWLGLLLALAVLGIPAFNGHDGGARWVTGLAAAIAATILALDIAIPPKRR
jgi:hypothetical protein